MFLLRVRLFTLINMDSLIILVKLCPSLSTMLKLSSVVGCLVVKYWQCMGDGAFECSLNLSPHVLADSHMCYSAALVVSLDAILTTNALETFSQVKHVWCNYVPCGFLLLIWFLFFMVIVALGSIALFEIIGLHPIKCPMGVLALCEEFT